MIIHIIIKFLKQHTKTRSLVMKRKHVLWKNICNVSRYKIVFKRVKKSFERHSQFPRESPFWMDGSDYLESTFQDGRKHWVVEWSSSHPFCSLLLIRESSSTFSVCSTLTLMESKRLCMPWPLSRVLVVDLLWLCARRLRLILLDGNAFSLLS